MVGVPGAVLGAEGDDDGRIERVHDGHERRAQLAKRVERGKAGVRQAQQVELAHAKPVGGAPGLLGARGGQFGAGGNAGKVANPLGAVGGDDEMRGAPLARELCQQRRNDAFVVGVGEDGEHGTTRLGVCGNRRKRGERRGDEGRERNAHDEKCSHTAWLARHEAREVDVRETRPARLWCPWSRALLLEAPKR